MHASTEARPGPKTYNAEQVAEIVARALRADRARILAILGSPLCAGRFKLADHLCFNTDVPWRQALEILKIAPSGDESPGDETEDERAARILRIGELVGQVDSAIALVDETNVSSYHAATLLVAGVE